MIYQEEGNKKLGGGRKGVGGSGEENHPYLQQCDSSTVQERPQDGFQALRQEATVKCRQMSNDQNAGTTLTGRVRTPRKAKVILDTTWGK